MQRIDSLLNHALAQLQDAHVRGLPPHYAPTYDSPIEALFAGAAQHHLRADVRVETQVEVMTRLGRFRLDFVLTAPDGWRIGLECDGAAFHDQVRDAFRDAAILGGAAVDSIVRLRGTDIATRLWDILYALGRAFPALFSERGHRLAQSRTSRPALEQVPSGWGRLAIRYPDLRCTAPSDAEDPVDDPSDVVPVLDPGGEVLLLHRGRGRHGLSGWQRRYARILAHPTRTIADWTRLTLAARSAAWATRQPVRSCASGPPRTRGRLHTGAVAHAIGGATHRDGR